MERTQYPLSHALFFFFFFRFLLCLSSFFPCKDFKVGLKTEGKRETWKTHKGKERLPREQDQEQVHMA